MTALRLDFAGLGLAFHAGRKALGLSEQAVAEATGLSKATVCRAERMSAERPVSLHSGLVLCRFYHIDPRKYLFHGNTPLKHVDFAEQNFEARP